MEEKKIILNSLTDDYMVKLLGEGKNAKCYLTRFNNAFKYFNEPLSDYYDILKNAKYYSDVICFPDTLIFNDHGQLIGYLMKYISGQTLEQINPDTDIYKYIESLKKVEEEIAKFSAYRIYLRDVGFTNIIYTSDNEMKIIDTDFYDHDSRLKDLYAKNMVNFSFSVLYPLIDRELFSIYDFKSDKLKKYRDLLVNGRMLPSVFLEEVLDIHRNSFTRAKTINELNKTFKLL